MSPKRSKPKPEPTSEASNALAIPDPQAGLQEHVDDIRDRVARAKRDTLGFATENVPRVTEEQFEWLAWRLGVVDDQAANDATGTPPALLEAWKADPEFVALYQICESDPRAGFRMLGGSLLPKALRTIYGLLNSDSPKVQEKGLNYLLRTQGLLIDKPPTVDPDALGRLIEQLRAPQPAQIIDITPRQ